MNDFSNESPLTGDQCAICQAPLHEAEDWITEESGAILRVCSACALKHEEKEGEPQVALHETIDEIAEFRAKEESLLRRLASFSHEITDALHRLEDTLSRVDARVTALERDRPHFEERLQRTEAIASRISHAPPLPPPPTAPSHEPALPAAVDHEQEPAAPPVPAAAALPAESGAAGMEMASLTLEEIRMAQQYFNESEFTQKTRGVRRSLGRPMVSLVRDPADASKIILTIAWDIVWYQYLIGTQADIAVEERVVLRDEGMELDELAPEFKQENANLDDQGKLDASELEVEQLGTDMPLLEDLTEEEAAALDDATQEIWDQHSMPEFRWDE